MISLFEYLLVSSDGLFLVGTSRIVIPNRWVKSLLRYVLDVLDCDWARHHYILMSVRHDQVYINKLNFVYAALRYPELRIGRKRKRVDWRSTALLSLISDQSAFELPLEGLAAAIRRQKKSPAMSENFIVRDQVLWPVSSNLAFYWDKSTRSNPCLANKTRHSRLLCAIYDCKSPDTIYQEI